MGEHKATHNSLSFPRWGHMVAAGPPLCHQWRGWSNDWKHGTLGLWGGWWKEKGVRIVISLSTMPLYLFFLLQEGWIPRFRRQGILQPMGYPKSWILTRSSKNFEAWGLELLHGRFGMIYYIHDSSGHFRSINEGKRSNTYFNLLEKSFICSASRDKDFTLIMSSLYTNIARAI